MKFLAKISWRAISIRFTGFRFRPRFRFWFWHALSREQWMGFLAKISWRTISIRFTGFRFRPRFRFWYWIAFLIRTARGGMFASFSLRTISIRSTSDANLIINARPGFCAKLSFLTISSCLTGFITHGIITHDATTLERTKTYNEVYFLLVVLSNIG